MTAPAYARADVPPVLRVERGQTSENETDVGNAERFARLYGDRVRFVPPWGRWLIWDGCRLAHDTRNQHRAFAIETVRSIYQEASEQEEKARRRELANHAKRSESATRLRGMLETAQALPKLIVTPEQLDADPWMLNVQNGTLDLRTGELQPHRIESLITRVAPVAYDPAATSPRFLAFLRRVLAGDEELLCYLQRAVGYMLTGLTVEQVLFVLYGLGANGKSVFVTLLAEMLGDYATTADFSSFLERRGESIRNDLARLAGARFVAASESTEGRQLAEGMVKQLTGGDRIVARFLRAEHFEFRPQFKLALVTNHKPRIRGTDEGIWRRIRLVPFTVTIPEEERDPELAEKLREELPGILRWAVDGCLAWQRERLGTPARVREATEQYREEEDPLADFFDSVCVIESGASVNATELFNAYEGWAGKDHMKQTSFGRLLTQRGYLARKHPVTGLRVRDGIRLREALSPNRTVPDSSGQFFPSEKSSPTAKGLPQKLSELSELSGDDAEEDLPW